MDRIICITGANRGLGRALAEEFLDAGDMVISLSRKKPDSNNKALCHLRMDVGDDRTIRRAAETVSKKHGRIDILINNAAIHREPGSPDLETYTSEQFKKAMETIRTNAMGPLMVASHFMALLRKGRDRLMVNISSEAGSIGGCGRTGEFGYCMSKAALNMAVKEMHNKYKPEGFRIFAIHPGWVRTDMGGPQAHLAAAESAKAIITTLEKRKSVSDDIYFDFENKPMAW